MTTQPTPEPQAKSHQTTIGGLIAAIGMLLVGISAIFDKDPSTNADIPTILQAIGALIGAGGAAFGGMKARDDRVTSEGKVKKPPTKIGLILIPFLFFSGCCAQVDHVKLGTFAELEKSFTKIERTLKVSNVKRLDETDPKHGKKNAELNEAERQSVLSVCDQSRKLCIDAQGGAK